MRSSHLLARAARGSGRGRSTAASAALTPSTAGHNSSASAHAEDIDVDSAELQQAEEELKVYSRGMRTAERKWDRVIEAHKSQVRRLMIIEEQCKEKLKQEVLRETREQLKFLTNTDLMSVSQLVIPPSIDVFIEYKIPAEQVTGFSVYVMGCLLAEPNRLNLSMPMLIADLSSAWAILPPAKRGGYNELAEIFRSELPTRKQAREKAAAAAGAKRPSLRTAIAPTVTCAEVKLKAAKARVAAVVKAYRPELERMKPSRGGRRGSPSSSSTSASRRNTKANIAKTIAAAKPPIGPARSRLHAAAALHAPEVSEEAVDVVVNQLPEEEREGFCHFAYASLRDMEQAIGTPLTPSEEPGKDVGTKKRGQAMRGGRGSRRAATSSADAIAMEVPREIRLFLREWIPIAFHEWTLKSRRQKTHYMKS